MISTPSRRIAAVAKAGVTHRRPGLRTIEPNRTVALAVSYQEPMASGERKTHDRSQDRWSWKLPGLGREAQPGLLYEPGNWGDILKGTWALLTVRHLLESETGEVLYTDPFAGRPDYPASPAARRRISGLGDHPFARAQAPWLARNRVASTARIVLQAGCGRIRARLGEASPEALAEWQRAEVPKVELEPGGWKETVRSAGSGLMLIDPYDLFDRRLEILPRLPEPEAGALLLYYYNRAPRGGGHLRAYEHLRTLLARRWSGRMLIGRVAGDAVLPRGFHEVVLVARPAFLSSVERELGCLTRELAARQAAAGAFEGLEPPEPAAEDALQAED